MSLGKGVPGIRRNLAIAAVGSGAIASVLLVALGGSATAARNAVQVSVAAFNTQPVVLTGQAFPSWSSGPEVTARAPQVPNDYGVYNSQANQPSGVQSDCYSGNPQPDANGYTDPTHN